MLDFPQAYHRYEFGGLQKRPSAFTMRSIQCFCTISIISALIIAASCRLYSFYWLHLLNIDSLFSITRNITEATTVMHSIHSNSILFMCCNVSNGCFCVTESISQKHLLATDFVSIWANIWCTKCNQTDFV